LSLSLPAAPAGSRPLRRALSGLQLTLPAAKLTLEVAGLTVVARKAYEPCGPSASPASAADEAASAAWHHPGRFRFSYAAAYDYLSSLESSRAAGATSLLSSYLPSLRGRGAAGAGREPQLLLAAVKALLALVHVSASRTAFALLHAEAGEALRCRRGGGKEPGDPTACATVVKIETLRVAPYYKTKDMAVCVFGLAVSTGRRTDPGRPFPADAPTLTDLQPASAASPADVPASLNVPSVPTPLHYTLDDFLSPADVIVLLPTLPNIVLSAAAFQPNPAPNAVSVRVISQLRLSAAFLHPVLHAIDDYVDESAPYTLFCSSLHASLFSGAPLPVHVPPSHRRFKLGRLDREEGELYMRLYAASLSKDAAAAAGGRRASPVAGEPAPPQPPGKKEGGGVTFEELEHRMT
jgi:hypothetical protein